MQVCTLTEEYIRSPSQKAVSHQSGNKQPVHGNPNKPAPPARAAPRLSPRPGRVTQAHGAHTTAFSAATASLPRSQVTHGPSRGLRAPGPHRTPSSGCAPTWLPPGRLRGGPGGTRAAGRPVTGTRAALTEPAPAAGRPAPSPAHRPQADPVGRGGAARPYQARLPRPLLTRRQRA